MAKPFQDWIGNSCHIHSSLWRDGDAVLRRRRELFSRWLAGQIACFEELALFLAPTINSYKRFAAGSWAPTTLAWGNDNRTCGFRVVGHGAARRAETRIPGGDANPYLAFAAVIAAGLHGIEHELELPPALEGNAYESDARAVPVDDARGDRRARGRGDGARARSATRSSTTTSTTRGRSSGCTTPSSPTGSGSGTTSAGERECAGRRRRGFSLDPSSCTPRGALAVPWRAAVRPIIGITSYAQPARWGRGSFRPRSSRSTTSTRSSRPAAGRSSCRRARRRRGDAGRARRDRLLGRHRYRPRPLRRRPPPGDRPGAGPPRRGRAARCSRRRSSATFRRSRSAAASSC